MTVTLRSYEPSSDELTLRGELRRFVAAELGSDLRPSLGMGGEHDPDFSRKLARAGWVGMALPRRYGGSESGAYERWVVSEELLALAAPVRAHWISDRQTGPLIARFGSESLRERFLPPMAAGECFMSIGMSEPDAGSDLASVRTSAVPVEGGWLLSGTKVWTTDAHRNHFIVVLCRTDASDDRHGGLSQIIVDLKSDGVVVNPIPFLDGTHDFNEVVFTDVFVPAENLIGERGEGWTQVTSELVSERAGPDRYMSVYQLIMLAMEHIPELLEGHMVELGAILARFTTIRQMSMSVAIMIDEGTRPGALVPMVKDLGTTFEQEAVRLLRNVVAQPLRLDGHGNAFEERLVQATLCAPSFTLRGGTNEILRNLVARGLS